LTDSLTAQHVGQVFPGEMTNNISAVILAGGFGTRLQGVLKDLPKPMAPVAGRPFVEWIIRALYAHGITRFALSTGYLAQTIDTHFRNHPVSGCEIRCIPESEPIGTAGGFLNAAHGSGFQSEVWLVCNGDSIVVAGLDGFFDSMSSSIAQPGASVLALWQKDASRYGTLDVGLSGNLEGFREKQPGSGLINAGMYLFRSEILGLFPERRPLSLESDVFPELLGADIKICATRVEGAFLDIGLPDTLAEADDFVQKRLVPFMDHKTGNP